MEVHPMIGCLGIVAEIPSDGTVHVWEVQGVDPDCESYRVRCVTGDGDLIVPSERFVLLDLMTPAVLDLFDGLCRWTG